MNRLQVSIFLFIMANALLFSMLSYHHASSRIENDVNNALELTLAEMPTDVVSADTIRCYRNYLTITELKDKACIAMKAVCRDEKETTEMVAEANCGFMTVFMLSDQRASGALLFIGILWIMGSLWYMKKFKPELLIQGISYGGIIYANEKFMTSKGKQISLSPMQHTLLEMFITSESHSLTKQEICDRLWPKKTDASDTLYTLIKRVKPIIENNSELKIESDRGKSYSLKIK